MSNKMRFFVFLLVLCSAMVNAYAGETVKFSKLQMPLTPGSNGVAFFHVTSTQDDSILSAKSDCCDAVELHTHTMEKGIMRMRRVDSVPLKANVATVFQPGALHVMLIDIKEPLKAGDKVPVTFTFEKASEQKVVFTVTAHHLPAAKDSSSHH